MAWEPYNLDWEAHKLVQNFYKTDAKSEAYKMRVTVAYGLERFWGEQLRLSGDDSEFWRQTWNVLRDIMNKADIVLPTIDANPDDLWNFPKVCLSFRVRV